MKDKIHPKYKKVLFFDSTTQTHFIVPSTVDTNEVMTFEGVEYPLVRVTISSAGHPLWTGKNKLLDTEGRMDKFAKKYAKAEQIKVEVAAKHDEAADKAKVAKKKK